MKLTLLCLFLIKLGSCVDDVDFIVNVVKAISRSKFFEFFIVLYSRDENRKVFYERLAGMIHTNLKYSMISLVSIEDYEQFQQEKDIGECLKIVDGKNGIVKEKFLTLSRKINIGDGDVWLLFLEEPSEKYLDYLILPFNVRLIVASIKNSSIELIAPYKVAKNYPLRLSSLVRWNVTNNSDFPKILLDVTKRDMEGYKLIAGTINYPPVTSIKNYKDGSFTVHGYLIQIWHEVSEVLNFTYKYILPPDKGVGSRESNGSWNGLMGMIMRNEIDVIVTSLIMTESRRDAVDFSVPTMISGFQVFFLESEEIRIRWESLFRPFRQESWFAILGWLIAAPLSLSLVYSIGCSFKLENRRFKREYSITGSFFIVFRAFTNQANNMAPQSISSRIVFSLTYILMGVLVPAYTSAWISYLTVRTPVIPFQSLENMLEVGTHKIMPAQKTADYNFFSEASEPLLKNVYNKLIAPLDESTLPLNPKQGIEMVCKIKNVAYFGCELSARLFADEYLLSDGCKFLTFQNRISLIYKGIVFPRKSPYFSAINAQLKKIIRKGLLRRYENDIWSPKKEIMKPYIDGIAPDKLYQIYCVFLGGVVLSVFIFIIETFNCKKENFNKQSFNI